jgi:hypothetical protein
MKRHTQIDKFDLPRSTDNMNLFLRLRSFAKSRGAEASPTTRYATAKGSSVQAPQEESNTGFQRSGPALAINKSQLSLVTNIKQFF